MNWLKKKSVLIGFSNGVNSSPINEWNLSKVKIAGFDFDDTLIHHYKRLKEMDNPWILLTDEVSNKFKLLIKERWLIVIFTNQSNLANKESEWKSIVDDFYIYMCESTETRFQLIIMAACENDIYRKPNLGMDNMLMKLINANVVEMFFVGDAAGRLKRDFFRKKFYPSGKVGDFSDSDYKFALNLGCSFYTPEAYFIGESETPQFKTFNPRLFLRDHPPENYSLKHKKLHLVIIVGYPSVGKTHLAKKYYPDYLIVSKDDFKSPTKYDKEVMMNLKAKKNIVIANTSPDSGSRIKWTMIAKSCGYKNITCVVIGTSIQLAYHLNNVRMLITKTAKLDVFPYYKFRKSYIPPSSVEGFTEIIKLRWRIDPDLLKDPKWKKAFLMYSEGVK